MISVNHTVENLVLKRFPTAARLLSFFTIGSRGISSDTKAALASVLDIRAFHIAIIVATALKPETGAPQRPTPVWRRTVSKNCFPSRSHILISSDAEISERRHRQDLRLFLEQPESKVQDGLTLVGSCHFGSNDTAQIRPIFRLSVLRS